MIHAAAGLMALVASQAVASSYSDFNAGIVASLHAPDLAIKDFTAALADPALLPSLRPVALMDRGTAYFGKKQFDLALADYTASLALRPDFDVLQRRGLIYYEQRKFDLAMADFSAAVALRPDIPRGYSIRINLYLENKRYDDAVADGNRLIALEPSPANYVERSQALRLAGKFREALADADSAIAIESRLAGPYFSKAAVYEVQGQYDASIEALDVALRFQPASTMTIMKKGIVQWEAKKFDDAVATFAHAIAIEPKNPYAFLWLQIAQSASRAAGGADRSADRGDTGAGGNRHDDGTGSGTGDIATLDARRQGESADAQKPDGDNAADGPQIAEGSSRQHGAAPPPVAPSAASPDVSGWPGALVKLYQGAGTFAAALAEARTDTSFGHGKMCEAEFYGAQWRIMHGKMPAAKALLSDAVRDCPYSFVEAPAAANQIKGFL
jgi:tetratricopeptide (TPR) repeat protein